MDAALASGLYAVLSVVFKMVQILVIASVIVSWVGADPNNTIVQMIYQTTEPIYRPLRRLTSRIPGPFDWAPMVAILIIIFLQNSVLRLLGQWAR